MSDDGIKKASHKNPLKDRQDRDAVRKIKLLSVY